MFVAPKPRFGGAKRLFLAALNDFLLYSPLSKGNVFLAEGATAQNTFAFQSLSSKHVSFSELAALSFPTIDPDGPPTGV